MIRKIAAFLLLIFLFSSVVFATDEELRFLSLADIHFNPFSSCHEKKSCKTFMQLQQASVEKWPAILSEADVQVAKSGQDTNFPLLISALNQAKQIADKDHIQFVLILGDFLGHDFRTLYTKYSPDKTPPSYRLFVKKTLIFLANLFAKNFPNTNVYVLIGNNDSYQDDYVSQPGGVFFKDFAEIFSKLIHDKENREEFKTEFPNAGYYAINLTANENIKLIMLNSVLFSNKAIGRGIAEAAQQELSWLHEELTISKVDHQKVFIATHIPSTIDINITPSIHFALFKLWKNFYINEFNKNLQEFSFEIAGLFAGHLHSEWYQVLTFKTNDIPVLGVPAVSPIFGGIQGFTVYDYALPSMELSHKKMYRID